MAKRAEGQDFRSNRSGSRTLRSRWCGTARSRLHGFVVWLLAATIAVSGLSSDLNGQEFRLDPAAPPLRQPTFVQGLVTEFLRSVPPEPTRLGRDTRPFPPPLSAPALPAQLPELDRALVSYGYASSVGGIAFGRVAAAATPGVDVVSLRYDPALPDGSRLRVSLSTGSGPVEVAGDIPDWLLIPVARFASYRQCASFTAFGKLQDPQLEERLRGLGYYIYNYHPAFEDTLLGFRLLQADMLIIRPEAIDLPKEGGAYLLGFGEQPPDLTANAIAQSELQRTVMPSTGQPFRSYIVTDAGQNVTFGLSSDGQLTLEGYPYWHCWTTPNLTEAEAQAINDDANQRANDQLEQEHVADVASLGDAAAAAKYTDDYQNTRFDQLWDQIISPQMLVALPEFSATLSSEVHALGGVNPAVYEAVTSTLRYAALFRRVALLDPTGYATFAASLDCAPFEPWVDTPSAWAGTGGTAPDDGKTRPPPGSCADDASPAPSAGPASASTETGDSGCSCTVTTGSARSGWLYLLAPMLGLLWLRRRAWRVAVTRD